jgi:hypothetical protein
MLALAALLAAAATTPPATIVSPAPDRVSLTVYRDPDRRPGNPMDLRWLSGFALVTETRTVTLPAGDAVLRFEGVSDGIVPVSAVVTGLPGGTIEKNRDARLLSPAALVDGTLGRRVTLRRTDRASGRTSEEQATIVAGPANGVVLRTASGIETLGCSGLGEGLRYDGVPPDLAAKPVLSVTTHSPAAAPATVTLAYLASGFDWTASYVATLDRAERRLDLFAWLTLANGNAQGYADVEVQAVAGRLERQYVEPIRQAAASLELRCYPLGTTTSDLPPPVAPPPLIKSSGDIVVTAMRMAAPAPPPPPPPPPRPEELGDLKLYRVPARVAVAAAAQKQVALLHQPNVAFERGYLVSLPAWQAVAPMPSTVRLHLLDKTSAGLGIPLPAGTTALYGHRGADRLLLGEGTIADTATGGAAHLVGGTSAQVMVEQVSDGERRWLVRLTNATRRPATVEVRIGQSWDAEFKGATAPLPRSDGVQTWRATVPANGSAELRYRTE